MKLEFCCSYNLSMKKLLLLFAVCILYLSTACKFYSTTLPTYQPIPNKTFGFSADTLQKAHAFFENTTRFDAFLAIKADSVLASWGKVDVPINTHSARKSIMSVLFGIAVEKGYINIDKTLAQLGIDDAKAPLTELEKTCTIRDLLMSRSGIYIEASGETKQMKDGRPKRGQYKPGSFFYYNNWDFNVLGTIFEQETRLTIGQAIDKWLAKPLGMKKFKPRFVEYKNASYSQHRQYIIYMSAEDLARIGMMLVNDGMWQGKQIVSKAWVDESTRPYSIIPKGNKQFNMYAYLWWNDTTLQTYSADGWGGQFMLVDKANKIVVVSRNDTKRSIIGQGLYMWLGKEGYRNHHQKLYELMKAATESNSLFHNK